MSKPTRQKYFVTPGDAFQDIESVRTQTGRLQYGIDVAWGDCDPAQIAYTANIPAWGLKAIEAWYQSCLGIGWYEINLDYSLGTPFVSLNFDFEAPVTPRHRLEIHVYVKKLGSSSLSHYVEGYQAEQLCFTGNTTAVFVLAESLNPVAIPQNMRQTIESYIAIQGKTFKGTNQVTNQGTNQGTNQ